MPEHARWDELPRRRRRDGSGAGAAASRADDSTPGAPGRIDVQMALLGVRWPATRATLLHHVTATGAPEEVVHMLRGLPPKLPEKTEPHYVGSVQVLAALGFTGC